MVLSVYSIPPPPAGALYEHPQIEFRNVLEPQKWTRVTQFGGCAWNIADNLCLVLQERITERCQHAGLDASNEWIRVAAAECMGYSGLNEVIHRLSAAPALVLQRLCTPTGFACQF
jgi:hypothetical protein